MSGSNSHLSVDAHNRTEQSTQTQQGMKAPSNTARSGIKYLLLSRYSVYLLISLMLLLSIHLGFDGQLGEWVNHHHIAQHNQAYLSLLSKAAVADLALVNELNSLLQAVQTSNVGISLVIDVNVSVGQALEVMTNLLDRAEQVLSSFVATLAGLKTALKLSEVLAPVALFLCLLSVIIYSLMLILSAIWYHTDNNNPDHRTLQQQHIAGNPMRSQAVFHHSINLPLVQVVRRLCRLILFFCLMIYWVVPYAIHGASIVNHFLVSDLSAHNSQQLAYTHHHLTQGEHSVDPKHRAKGAVQHLEHLFSKSGEKTEHLGHYVTNSLALNILTLLLPVGLLWLLGRVSQRLFNVFLRERNIGS